MTGNLFFLFYVLWSDKVLKHYSNPDFLKSGYVSFKTLYQLKCLEKTNKFHVGVQSDGHA